MTKRVDFSWLVFGCAFDWAVAAILYHSLFFRCLPRMSFSESGTVLAVMAAAMIFAGALIFGILMGKNDERTALLVTLFPYGLYSFAAYQADFPLLFGGAPGALWPSGCSIRYCVWFRRCTTGALWASW